MGTFEELYQLHGQAVFRFAMSRVGRRETAEDLTSEAFLALYQAARRPARATASRGASRDSRGLMPFAIADSPENTG
jgi:DNA-directed RNA polymerase specialized sigma24 family protein